MGPERNELKLMRNQLAAIAFVCCVMAAMPLAAAPASGTPDRDALRAEPAPVAVEQVPLRAVRDEVAMVLVGTALIGIAAAVRRAT